MNFETFACREAMIERALQLVVEGLREGLAQYGCASLIGSGGSTPGPLYDQLSACELDWSAVTVGLADERWVAPSSDDSNENLLRNRLLKNLAAKASFLPMKTNHARAADAVEQVNDAYLRVEHPFDVMILGMGADGHSLSWFPGSDGLEAAVNPDTVDYVAAVTARKSETTGVNLERMTLTYPAVATARRIVLMITGDTKKNVFLNKDEDLPVFTVRRAAKERLTVLWAP